MKNKILLIIIIVFIACSSSVKQDNPPITYIFSAEDCIDPQLYDIRNEFFKDAKRYGIRDIFYQKQLLLLKYNALPESIWGLCYPDIGFIFIDSTKMNADTSLIWIVTYHELAHFYLDAEHTDTCRLNIMMPVITKTQADSIYKNFNAYKAGMFRTYHIKKFHEKGIER